MVDRETAERAISKTQFFSFITVFLIFFATQEKEREREREREIHT